MENIKYPDFLNTEEKYNECVRNIVTVKQFEDVFRKILDDDSIPLIDLLKIMGKLEQDTITLTGNQDVKCIMDMAEAIINYHIISNKEKTKARLERMHYIQMKQKQPQKPGRNVCDCNKSAHYSTESEEESSEYDEDFSPRRNSC